MFFNSYEVVMMYLSKAFMGSGYEQAVSSAAEEMTSVQLQAGIAVYLLIAAVTTPIAICCVAWIAKNEGRQKAVQALLHRQNGSEAGRDPQSRMPMGRPQDPQPLVTVPLIVAIVLCLGFMSLELFLK